MAYTIEGIFFASHFNLKMDGQTERQTDRQAYKRNTDLVQEYCLLSYNAA
jgi:hypothetical protein